VDNPNRSTPEESAMSELVVNNPNIVVDAPGHPHEFLRTADAPRSRSSSESSLVRRVRQLRREIEELACSATWAEDCLYRGADYPPDFECSCPACKSRFPNRRHPRPVRESSYSLDCQVESDEDPELAEDLARLRNDRVRIGSVFVRRFPTNYL
jgi:hypothetical protein